MKLPSIATVLVIVTVRVRAEEAQPILLSLNDPQVITAMKTAWNQSAHGTLAAEAAFRLDGSPSDYQVIILPLTNEFRKQKVSIIPGKTFAVFHVHPTVTDPAPSRDDKSAADKFKMKILTMHRSGLYEYDPRTKRTARIRNGLDWLNRAGKLETRASAFAVALIGSDLGETRPDR